MGRFVINNWKIRQNTFSSTIRRMIMKLTPPKVITFWIGVVLGLLGLLSFMGVFTVLPIEAFWLAFLGFAVLALGLLVKGM
jgi:hypothetical protein